MDENDKIIQPYMNLIKGDDVDNEALFARLKREAQPGFRKQLREEMKKAENLKNRI